MKVEYTVCQHHPADDGIGPIISYDRACEQANKIKHYLRERSVKFESFDYRFPRTLQMTYTTLAQRTHTELIMSGVIGTFYLEIRVHEK